jgi:hypothetical protein
MAERCCVCGTARELRYRTMRDRPMCRGCGRDAWQYELHEIDLFDLFKRLLRRVRRADRRRQKARRTW